MGDDDKKEFVERVRRHFREITPQLNMEMAMIAELSWADTTSFLLIEYDASQFSDEFSVGLWAMDADGEPADREGHWFLKGRTVVVPSEIYDDEKYEAIEPGETASELLEQWFAKRGVPMGIRRFQRISVTTTAISRSIWPPAKR
ncbi:hypothetical protein ACTGJ9_027810 [Bradyrhizobium sp. RDM12]